MFISGVFAVPSCPDQSPLQGGQLLSDDYLFREGHIFSRCGSGDHQSSRNRACMSVSIRRDRIATVIAPEANSLFNWLGRRSGNHERSDSKGGIANLMWCRINMHASSISSDGVCVGAESKDSLRQIGIFGQSEGRLKMHNIRCKSKETTSFSGGVALSEVHHLRRRRWGRYIAHGRYIHLDISLSKKWHCRRKAGHSQRRLS